MTGQAAAARLLFGMAREGRLPRALARIDDRRGVPTIALGVAAALALVVAVWAARRDDGLSILVSIVDVGALAAFTLLHASVIGYFVVQKRAAFTVTFIVVPIIGALITVWVLIAASALAQIVGIAWCVIGTVAVLASRRIAAR
jgi:amino acid transporter